MIGSVWPGDDLFHVRRQLNGQREYPAIIGYHFLEEPGGRYSDRPDAIEMIQPSYMEVRRLDPNHFIDLIDWPESSYWRYEPLDAPRQSRYNRFENGVLCMNGSAGSGWPCNGHA